MPCIANCISIASARRSGGGSAGGIDQQNLLVEIPFDEGSGFALANKLAPETSNLYAFPEGPYPLSGIWTDGGATFGGGISDPDGGTNAWSCVGLTFFFAQQVASFVNGAQYTISCWFQSRNGLSQEIRFVTTGVEGVQTFPATGWTRLSKTFTANNTTLNTGIGWGGNDALDANFYGLKIEAGAVATTYVPACGNFVLLGDPPQWTSAGLDFNGSNIRWGTGQIQTANLTAISIYAVMRWPVANDPHNVDYVSILSSNGLSGSDQIYLTVGGGPATQIVPNPSARFQGAVVNSRGGVVRDGIFHLVTFTYDGTNLVYYIDGSEAARLSSPGLDSFTLKNLWLTYMGGAWIPGTISYLTVYSSAHARSKVKGQFGAYQNILTARSVTMTAPSLYLESEGDSISYGLAADFPYGQRAASGRGSNTQANVFAVTGSTMTEVNARAALVDAAVDAATTSVLTLLIGANDFSAGTTAADLLAAIKTYCLARKAAIPSRKIVVMTLLPNTRVGFNAYRSAFNILVAADSSFYDALCDFASDPVMGPDAAASDNSLYGDEIHPTQLGQDNLGDILAATLTALFP